MFSSSMACRQASGSPGERSRLSAYMPGRSQDSHDAEDGRASSCEANQDGLPEMVRLEATEARLARATGLATLVEAEAMSLVAAKRADILMVLEGRRIIYREGCKTIQARRQHTHTRVD